MPGADKFAKLDHKNTNCIFLGYTATNKNIYCEDNTSGAVLISKHMMFDKAHFSVPRNDTPLGAQALQRTGYSNECDTDSTKPVLIKLLSNQASTPSLSTPSLAGMDLSSASPTNITITPHGGT